jgi:ATP adenylyltransferase
MEHIWAPWRIQYIQSVKTEGCILCEKPKQDNDSANLILFRGDNNFIIMNLYPYNPGHLMVVPYRHIASPDDMNKDERYEHIDLINKSVKALRKILNPDGFNLGMNIGQVAGAGISDHIHTHIVPRWQGDNNFMTTVSDTRVVPQALAESYKNLKPQFK